MPRNRQDVPREERIRDLVEVARQLFVERGYAATSIAEIARTAGLAANSVYWYFPTKDHAFAAVLDRLLADEAEVLSGRHDLAADPEARLFSLLDRLDGYQQLEPVIHERVPHSPAIAESHSRAHAFLEQLLVEALQHRLPPGADRELAAAAVAATLEGAMGHLQPRYSFVELVRFVVDQLGGTPAGRA